MIDYTDPTTLRKPTTIYLAGPMRGYLFHNFPAFDHHARWLRSLGHDVISPAEMDRAEGFNETSDPADISFIEARMHDDLLVILEDVDAVAVMPGWAQSTGAKLEVAVARAVGTPVYWSATLKPVTDEEYAELTCEQVTVKFDGCVSGPVTWTWHDDEPLTSEVRIVDATTGGAKGAKPERFGLLPGDTLAAIARHFYVGASKYADRNWELGYSWELSFNALQRHLWAWWQGEDIDAETGSHHLDAVNFHSLALRTFVLRDIGTDDRPSSCDVIDLREAS